MRVSSLGTLRQLKELLPSFDLGFMDQEEFREFYKFSFQFSREGTHRTIERDIAAPLLQMVSSVPHRLTTVNIILQ